MKNNVEKLKINSVVKAVILAEMLLWSGWNFIMPIFSIYITKLPGGSVEKAATSFSVYLLSRVVFGLLSGQYLNSRRTRHKFIVMIIGMAVLSLSYIGLAFAHSIVMVYVYYGVIGLALGMAQPAKNALFSTSVKKEKSTIIWSVLDAGVFLSMAAAAIIGGIIAEQFGFQVLFFIASIVNFVAITPYLLYIRYWRRAGAIQAFGIQQFVAPYHAITDGDICEDDFDES